MFICNDFVRIISEFDNIIEIIERILRILNKNIGVLHDLCRRKPHNFTSSVCASKRWLFVSSTLLKQTIRSQLVADEYSTENVFILDGIVSTRRGSERHLQLVSEIMRLPATKVVEHPDIFVQNSEYTLDDFDYIIELRNDLEDKHVFRAVFIGNQLAPDRLF